MKIRFYTTVFFLLGWLVSHYTYGQTFNSVTSGDWSTPSTWDQGAVPTATNSSSIVIKSGHTVTIPNSYSVEADQIVVENSAKLAIAPEGMLDLLNGDATDLTINAGGRGITPGRAEISGTLIARNESSISAPQTELIFMDGGVYEHAYTTISGNIPLAIWNLGSTVLVSSYTTNGSAPGNLGQTFHNFVWNTPNLDLTPGSFIDLSGTLKTVKGNLTISSTGANFLSFSDGVDYTLTVEGDVLIENNSEVYFAYTQTNAQLNVFGNFTHTSSGIVGLTDAANFILDINGSFTLNASSGTFDFVTNYAGGTGNVNFNLGGDLNLSAGTFTKSSSAGTTSIFFDGITTQNYTSNISVTGNFNYTVKENAELALVGNSALQGSGNFTIENNAGLRLGSTAPDGALQESTIAGKGNILVSGTRTYGDYLTITYNGAGTQKTGLDFPETKNVSLIIDNEASSVTLSENITIRGTESLSLNKGTLEIGSNTLTINGAVTASQGNIGGTTTSTLKIGGTGPLGVIPFSSSTKALGNFEIARSSTGSVSLGSDLTVLNQLSLTDGQLILNGNILTLQGTLAQTSGSIAPDNTSGLIIQGEGAFGNLPFAAASEIGFLTVDRINSGTVGLSSSLTVSKELSLLNGSFENGTNLTLGNDAMISRAAGGSLSAEPNAAGIYNVSYLSGLTTGNELPTSANVLGDLKIMATGTVNLNQNITVNDSLYLANGTLDLGSRTVEVRSKFITNASLIPSGSTLILNGTVDVFGSQAPAFHNVQVAAGANVSFDLSSFSVSGNWQNEGTIVPGNSTLTFKGNTTISGSIAPTFHHIDLAGALTAPAGNLNVTGNWQYTSGSFIPNGGTVTFNGGNQQINNGAYPFYNTTFAGTGVKTLGAALDIENNLLIESGSSLDISSNNFTIAVAKSWTNNGTFLARTGRVTFNGSTTQRIFGSTTFHDVHIANISPNGVFNKGNNMLQGTLSFTDGTNIFDADGEGTDDYIFTLASNANGDARIGKVFNSSQLKGKFTVQRFIPNPGGQRVWRYMAVPTTDATVDSWRPEIPITGTFSDPSTGSGINSSSPSLYYYDESASGDINIGWVAYPTSGTAADHPLDNGTGYSVFIRSTGNVTADVRGLPKTGEVQMNIPYNPSGDASADGFNLIGNPYPSAIDWDLVNKSNLSGTIYLKDNANVTDIGAGNFAYYSAGGSVPASFRGEIASGQAFYVQALEGGGSITMNEDSKVGSATFIRKESPTNFIRLAIQGANSQKDEALIRFMEEGTDTFDYAFDAHKIKSNLLNLSTFTQDSTMLAINILSPFSCAKEIGLNIENAATGEYSLNFSGFESFDADNFDVFLIDRYTNQTVEIKTQNEYRFSVTSVASSQGNERFKLLVSGQAPKVDLAVSYSNVCTTESAAVFIENSEAGVSYQLVQGEEAVGEAVSGTGNTIQLAVNADQLAAGLNSFAIAATKPGCETLQLTTQVAIEVYNVPGTATAENSMACSNSSVTLTASGARDGEHYNWYASADATTPIKAEHQESFNTPVLASSASYYVAIVNERGCESAERTEVKAIITEMDAPEVALSSDLIRLSNYSRGTIQWYFNGELIEGATTESYIPTEAGEYYAEVSTKGCTKASNVVEFRLTALEDALSTEIRLYPVPTESLLTVALPENFQQINNIKIVDLNGKLIFSRKFEKADNSIELNTANFNSGYYILILEGKDTVIRKEFIKK